MVYNNPMTEKVLTSVRMTKRAKQLIKLIARKNGITQTAVIELAIRQMAKSENLLNVKEEN